MLDYQNNLFFFVGTLKIMSNAAKNVDILVTSLSVLYDIYFDSSIKLLFWSISSQNFRSFSKTFFSCTFFTCK